MLSISRRVRRFLIGLGHPLVLIGFLILIPILGVGFSDSETYRTHRDLFTAILIVGAICIAIGMVCVVIPKDEDGGYENNPPQ